MSGGSKGQVVMAAITVLVTCALVYAIHVFGGDEPSLARLMIGLLLGAAGIALFSLRLGRMAGVVALLLVLTVGCCGVFSVLIR